MGVVREGGNGCFWLGTNKAIRGGVCSVCCVVLNGLGCFGGFALGLFLCAAFGLDLDQFAAGGVKEASLAVFIDTEKVQVLEVFSGVDGLRESVIQLGIAFAGDVVGFGADHGHDVGGLGAHLLGGPGDVAEGLDEDFFGDAFGVVLGTEVFEVLAESLFFMVGDNDDVTGVAMLQGVHPDFLLRGFRFWTRGVLGIFAIRV